MYSYRSRKKCLSLGNDIWIYVYSRIYNKVSNVVDVFLIENCLLSKNTVSVDDIYVKKVSQPGWENKSRRRSHFATEKARYASNLIKCYFLSGAVMIYGRWLQQQRVGKKILQTIENNLLAPATAILMHANREFIL